MAESQQDVDTHSETSEVSSKAGSLEEAPMTEQEDAGVSGLFGEQAEELGSSDMPQPPPCECFEDPRIQIADELARLRSLERPVTSGSQRSRLEQFFNNTDEVVGAEARPPPVREELEVLSGQRRVSGILGNLRIRQALQRCVQPRSLVIQNSTAPRSTEPPHSSVETSATHSSAPTPESVTPRNATTPQRRRSIDQQAIWSTIQEVQRETLVTDIIDLVHQRMVSAALNGRFRNTLERLVAHRVEHVGNGEQVQQFVQALTPTTPVLRNDFSHMGIDTTLGIPETEARSAQAASSLHAVSSIRRCTTHSAAFQNVPGEILFLKRQLQELTTLVQRGMLVQMDIQRSIRQEVSAALNATRATNETQTVPLPNRPPKATKEGQCIICSDNSVDAVLYRCGHMCVCLHCGLELRRLNHNCPVCRAPIDDVIRAFKTNFSE